MREDVVPFLNGTSKTSRPTGVPYYTMVMYDDEGPLFSATRMAGATFAPQRIFDPNATYPRDKFNGIRVESSNNMVVELSGKWIY